MKRVYLIVALLALLSFSAVFAAGEGDETPEAAPVQLVETMAVSGVQPPERFAMPETQNIVCESEGVRLVNAGWQAFCGGVWTEQTAPFAPKVPYRVLVTLSLLEGYAFAEAPGAAINGEPAQVQLFENGAELTLEFAPIELPFYRVCVIDGVASIQGRVITLAQPGTVVQLRGSILPEGQVFARWVVTAGDAVLLDETAFRSAFVMPEGDVEIRAVFEPKPDPDTCVYCSRVHRGFFGTLVRRFHQVLQYFRELRH